MRAAVLISGQPRFCKEFDAFLEKLTGYDQLDWFFFLWSKSEPTTKVMNSDGHQVIAPFWHDLTEEKVRSKLQENFPFTHNIAAIELEDPANVIHEPITTNYAKEIYQPSTWQMFYGVYKADQLRQKYQEQNNFKYDAVIRTRPDVSLIDTLDLRSVKQQIENNDNIIIQPRNKQCGYGVQICDLFAVASAEAMKKYSDLYNHIPELHQSGIMFHPETMLAHYLKRNGMSYENGNFGIDFRREGLWVNKETGQTFRSNEVPTWINYFYISEFGRWA